MALRKKLFGDDVYMNIFLAAHYNLNNGDRALLEATVGIIKRLAPDSKLTVSAYIPKKLNDRRFTTVNWALRNGLYEKILLRLSEIKKFRIIFRKYYRIICDSKYISAIENADIVFISGGHHLTDILSNRGYYKLSSNFIVPILMGKKIILLPQTIGPAENNDIIKSIKWILKKSYSVAYRDQSSSDFIKKINARCNNRYVPDLAFSLYPNKSNICREKTVGIALYHCYVDDRRKTILPFTLSNLVKVIDELLNRRYKVLVIPMDRGDEKVYTDLYNKVNYKLKNESLSIACKGDSINELIDKFRGLSFVLAYKTHSVVFSLICNTPLIAIAYHPKSREFMDNIGLGEYSVDDRDASYEKLIELINRLEDRIEEVKKTELVGVNDNRLLIDDYLKEIFSDIDRISKKNKT